MGAFAAGSLEKRFLHHRIVHDIFSKDANCFNHITGWLDFHFCYFSFLLVVVFCDQQFQGKHNRSSVKMPPITAQTQLSQ